MVAVKSVCAVAVPAAALVIAACAPNESRSAPRTVVVPAPTDTATMPLPSTAPPAPPSVDPTRECEPGTLQFSRTDICQPRRCGDAGRWLPVTLEPCYADARFRTDTAELEPEPPEWVEGAVRVTSEFRDPLLVTGYFRHEKGKKAPPGAAEFGRRRAEVVRDLLVASGADPAMIRIATQGIARAPPQGQFEVGATVEPRPRVDGGTAGSGP